MSRVARKRKEEGKGLDERRNRKAERKGILNEGSNGKVKGK